MRYIIIIAGFLLLSSLAFSQSNSFDERLLSLYSQEQIESLLVENPDVISFWTYYLDSGYFISDYIEKKHGHIENEVSLSGTLNLLELKIFPGNSGVKQFVDRENGKVLTVLPNEKIAGQLNENKKLEITE